MLDRLESAFVEQRRFLDDAGHELRTPLTVLRGHLEVLDTRSQADVDETRDLLLDEVVGDDVTHAVAGLAGLDRIEDVLHGWLLVWSGVSRGGRPARKITGG
jgi:signal transduction histidine kinase